MHATGIYISIPIVMDDSIYCCCSVATGRAADRCFYHLCSFNSELQSILWLTLPQMIFFVCGGMQMLIKFFFSMETTCINLHWEGWFLVMEPWSYENYGGF